MSHTFEFKKKKERGKFRLQSCRAKDKSMVARQLLFTREKVHSQIELGVVAWGCSVKLVAQSLVYQKKKTVFTLPFSRLPQFSLIQFNFVYIVPIHNNR